MIASTIPGRPCGTCARQASIACARRGATSSKPASRSIVVDIGRELGRTEVHGRGRGDTSAQRIDKIAEAQPSALAIDILLAARAPDPGDAQLAQALGRLPVRLASFSTRSRPRRSPARCHCRLRRCRGPGPLHTPGATSARSTIDAAGQGGGVISLPAPRASRCAPCPCPPVGRVRCFPASRSKRCDRARRRQSHRLRAAASLARRRHHIALAVRWPHATALSRRKRDALLGRSRRRTCSAAALIQPSRRQNRIAWRQRSGSRRTRLTAVDPLVASVDIQAEAIAQILRGTMPWRRRTWTVSRSWQGSSWASRDRGGAVPSPRARRFRLAHPGVAVDRARHGFQHRPVLAHRPDRPPPPSLRRRASSSACEIRVHLSPAALPSSGASPSMCRPKWCAASPRSPGELRLTGETRIITVLFTDIEDFTALTERVGAEAVVVLLDRYVDLVAGIIVAHGGMVDKIVGDAVHRFLQCAARSCPIMPKRRSPAPRRSSRRPRRSGARPASPRSDLGRTRIGIETGPAILGEVGRGAKRDYTAYGRPLNLASRLQTANKTFGSSIALGPGTVAALAGRIKLTRLGALTLRGIGDEVEVYTPETDTAPLNPCGRGRLVHGPRLFRGNPPSRFLGRPRYSAPRICLQQAPADDKRGGATSDAQFTSAMARSILGWPQRRTSPGGSPDRRCRCPRPR